MKSNILLLFIFLSACNADQNETIIWGNISNGTPIVRHYSEFYYPGPGQTITKIIFYPEVNEYNILMYN